MSRDRLHDTPHDKGVWITGAALAAPVIPAVAARKQRRMVAGREKALPWLERVSPGLGSQVVRRMKET